MKRTLLLLSFFSLPVMDLVLYAQAPVIEWQKVLGGNIGEYPFSIEATSDGGYIVAGQTQGPDSGDIMGYHGNGMIEDIWIVKLNANGVVQWSKCLGGFFTDLGGHIHQTSDGGYIIAGTSFIADCNGNHKFFQYWVVKLAANGNIQWEKNLGGSNAEYAYSISNAADGGYFIAGYSESSDGDVTVNHGNRDAWITKLDGNGNLQWQKSIGGSLEDEARYVEAMADGGCIIVGNTKSNDVDINGNYGGQDMFVVKLSNTGSIQWLRCYGGSNYESAASIHSTTDGGYILGGTTGSNDGNVSGNHHTIGLSLDYWFAKLDNVGNIQWQKCYGGFANEIAYEAQLTSDGGYIMSGTTDLSNGDVTCFSGVEDIWLVKINSAGTLEWQKSIGGNSFDRAECIRTLSDGSYIIGGSTCSTDIPGFHTNTNSNGYCSDFWIIKLSAAGTSLPEPVVTIDPTTTTVCAGTTVTIKASALYAGANPVYQWQRNGIPINNNSPNFTASNFVDNEVIICQVTRNDLCGISSASASDTAIIHINPNTTQPQITITAGTTIICGCISIRFDATVVNGGSSPFYQWKVNGKTEGENRNSFTTNLLHDADMISCVYSDPSVCIAGGSVASNNIIMITTSGLSPSVNIVSSSNNICVGSSVTLTASTLNAGPNPSYQWKVNGANAGTNNSTFSSSSFANGDVITCAITVDPTFTCISGTNATSNSITINVTNGANPSVNITTSSTTVCTGSSVTFNATALNAGTNPSYQWKVNGLAAGSNNNVFTTSTLMNGDIVSCTVTVDPLFTCATVPNINSNSITMNVINQSSPSISISAPGNDACEGNVIVFTATAINVAFPTYQWKVNNVNAGTNSTTYSSSSLSDGDQVYCEIIPNNSSCSFSTISSNIISVKIKELPAISIIPKDTAIMIGGQVQLNATISGNIASYTWIPSDKLIDPLSLTPTTIPLNNDITYRLSVTDNNGCTANENTSVKVLTQLYMPTAFTPNNDGLNDTYRIPPNVSLTLKEFSIYDRWGNQLFKTTDKNKGWDGTINGKKLSTGAYIYLVKGSDDKGEIFLKGTFVLVR